MATSEKAFAALVIDRLIDTEQVRELLGLKTNDGIRYRIEKGWLSGPIIVRDRGYSLWDRQQVERQEADRLAAVAEVAKRRAERPSRRVRASA